MKKLLTLIAIIIAFSFAEDEYPYFSDVNKQLDFEKKKISFGLLSDDISIDGNKIEIDEFFGVIGLVEDEQKVKKIKEDALANYQISYEDFVNKLNKYLILKKEGLELYQADSIIYSNKYRVEFENYKTKKDKKSQFTTIARRICVVSYSLYLYLHWIIDSESGSFSSNKMPFFISGFLSSFFVLNYIPNFEQSEEYKKLKAPRKNHYLPEFSGIFFLPTPPKELKVDYGYSIETLLNLAESYNRKVYERMILPK